MSYLTGTGVETSSVRITTTGTPPTQTTKLPPPNPSSTVIRVPVKGQPIFNNAKPAPIPKSPTTPATPTPTPEEYGPTPMGWIMAHKIGLGIASAVVLVGGYFVFRKKKPTVV